MVTVDFNDVSLQKYYWFTGSPKPGFKICSLKRMTMIISAEDDRLVILPACFSQIDQSVTNIIWGVFCSVLRKLLKHRRRVNVSLRDLTESGVSPLPAERNHKFGFFHNFQSGWYNFQTGCYNFQTGWHSFQTGWYSFQIRCECESGKLWFSHSFLSRATQLRASNSPVTTAHKNKLGDPIAISNLKLWITHSLTHWQG